MWRKPRQIRLEADPVVNCTGKIAGAGVFVKKISTNSSWSTYNAGLPWMNGVLYSARSNGLWRIDTTTPVNEPEAGQVVAGPNFPNPFSGSTTIPVELKKSGWVEFTVFDRAGNLIGRIWDGDLPAATHRLIVDADGLPTGAYLGWLRTASGVFTWGMILLR